MMSSASRTKRSFTWNWSFDSVWCHALWGVSRRVLSGNFDQHHQNQCLTCFRRRSFELRSQWQQSHVSHHLGWIHVLWMVGLKKKQRWALPSQIVTIWLQSVNYFLLCQLPFDAKHLHFLSVLYRTHSEPSIKYQFTGQNFCLYFGAQTEGVTGELFDGNCHSRRSIPTQYCALNGSYQCKADV